jgi:C-terminal processing protease CtpA/Prc
MVGRLNENKLTIGGVGTASEWNSTLDSVMSKWLTHQLQTGVDNYRKETASKEKRQSASVLTAGAALMEKPAVAGSFYLQRNEDGFGPSDHSSFYGKKVPVLFFFTGTHADYHKPTDTSDKINYEGLARITSYVGEIAKAVDSNPTRPTYAVAKSSAPMGQVRLSVSLGTIPSYGDTTDGMVLDGVRDNSPAAKAGLKAGDKVVKLAGKDVRNAMDYTYVLGSMKPGEEYEVEIIRGTERMTLKIIPAAAARRP